MPRIDAKIATGEACKADDAGAKSKGQTVLLVEDDRDVRVVIAAQLKQLGYTVYEVGTALAALDLIASPADIDIMLTDMVLPGGMDGMALVKEAARARPGMGLLCISGYDPTQANRKWLHVQNITFLEKPFSGAQLAQALNHVLVS